jgi:hypothetical protein
MQNIEKQEEITAQPQLIVTEEIRSYIYDIAKWAHFLAIVGFVISGFMLLAALTVGSAISTNPELAKMLGAMGNIGSGAITFVFIAYGLAIFYPSLLLFKHASKAKQGVLYGEQESLNDAFSKLKSLFKFWGVIVIIFIGLNLFSVFARLVG